MATNKRKDAAALFELIDKSTLKVPKHAGSLKIPDWWSSKANPATEASTKAVGEEDLPPAETKTDAPATVVPAQPRLFEPPPATAKPSTSPSIRPPVINGANPSPPLPSSTSPAVAPAPPSPISPSAKTFPVADSKTAVASPREAVSSASAQGAARPAAARMFAPQTMDQGNPARSPWAGMQRRRMARTPRWAIIAGIAAFFIVIVLVGCLLWFLKGRSGSATTAGTSQTFQQQPSGDDGATLLPPPARSGSPRPGLLPPAQPSPAPLSEDSQTTPNADEPVESATVHGPSTVARTSDLFYVMISSTPTPSVAQKNAEFLAHHGIDVSIEIVAGPGGKGRWFKIISVKGFPTMVAAEPFRKQIVQIGHLTPDFKKGKKVWDDAFITHVTSIAKK